MLKDWLAPDEQGGMTIPFHPVHLHRGVLGQLTRDVSPCVNRASTKPYPRILLLFTTFNAVTPGRERLLRANYHACSNFRLRCLRFPSNLAQVSANLPRRTPGFPLEFTKTVGIDPLLERFPQRLPGRFP